MVDLRRHDRLAAAPTPPARQGLKRLGAYVIVAVPDCLLNSFQAPPWERTNRRLLPPFCPAWRIGKMFRSGLGDGHRLPFISAAALIVMAAVLSLASAQEDDEDSPYRPGLIVTYAAGDRSVTRVDEVIAFDWQDAACDPRLRAGG